LFCDKHSHSKPVAEKELWLKPQKARYNLTVLKVLLNCNQSYLKQQAGHISVYPQTKLLFLCTTECNDNFNFSSASKLKLKAINQSF